MKFSAECYESKRGDTLFSVKMEKDDGQLILKELELSSFLKLLDSSVVREETYLHIKKDFIPHGYIDGHFVSDRTYTCVWEVKGKKRQLIYDPRTADGSVKHHVLPFPDLVFGLSVLNGVRQSFYCYAKKEGGSKLCHYPFGNVSSNGSVCMGNISSKGITPLSTEEDFFLGVTNNDYYAGMEKCGMNWSQTRLFEELAGKDKYPDNWLVETNVTVEKFLERFAKY